MKASNNQWWRGGVIYQVYPRSFADSNGDGIGDLPGITSRLEHIAGLGADAVWLSPFFKSPMKDFGYDVSDYNDVDPMFGTLDDFKRLVDRAHALGSPSASFWAVIMAGLGALVKENRTNLVSMTLQALNQVMRVERDGDVFARELGLEAPF